MKYAIFMAVLLVSPVRSGPAEGQFKAALVVSFARFTDWPPELKKVRLCVAADGSQLPRLISQVSQSANAGGRPIEAVTITKPGEAPGCQLLVLPDNVPEWLVEAYIKTARSGQILTIGEHRRFLDKGGAVRLFLEDGQMRFEVSVGALQGSEVAVSTKLLRLGYLRRDEK
jgi:hypothetical protein